MSCMYVKEIKLPTSTGSLKKQESSRKTSISALLTMPKPLTVWITINSGKFWEMWIPDHLTCLLKNLYAGQEATVRTGHGTRKGVLRLYIVTLLIYLICRVHHQKLWAGRSKSWNQDCREKYQSPQICRWHHPYGRKWRGTKKLLMKVKEESEKVGLKLNIQKTMIMTSGSITSRQIDGETMETMTDFIFWSSKSLQMVTVAMKLKDVYSLEGKLWPT